jgi:hypothetical protein
VVHVLPGRPTATALIATFPPLSRGLPTLPIKPRSTVLLPTTTFHFAIVYVLRLPLYRRITSAHRHAPSAAAYRLIKPRFTTSHSLLSRLLADSLPPSSHVLRLLPLCRMAFHCPLLSFIDKFIMPLLLFPLRFSLPLLAISLLRIASHCGSVCAS